MSGESPSWAKRVFNKLFPSDPNARERARAEALDRRQLHESLAKRPIEEVDMALGVNSFGTRRGRLGDNLLSPKDTSGVRLQRELHDANTGLPPST